MKFLRSSAMIAASLVSIAGSAVLVKAQTASTTTVSAVSVQIQATACPVISTFLKQGISNDKAAVIKLQRYLKDSERLDVDVSGSFDQKTEEAVKAFQKKYADTILTPWGATKASGIVYITTAKKINQLACGEAMALDQKDLAVMADYDARAAASASDTAATGSVSAASAAQEADPVVTYPSDPGNTQHIPVTGPVFSAAAVMAPGSSLIARFEQYLSDLF